MPAHHGAGPPRARRLPRRRGGRVVVIGAGPNGLVAANLLADAGFAVLVLEAESQPGGSVRSSADVAAGFEHDTFSSFYPLAAASPVITALRLTDHGLRWRHAPAVLGHPRPDGSWAVLHRRAEDTAAGLEAQQPGDGDAWLGLCAEWDAIGPGLVEGLLRPFPPLRAGVRTLPALARLGGLGYLRELLTPVLGLAERRFAGEAARLLLVGNALHSDIPLTSPGSAVFALMLTMLGQTSGFVVPEGGAQRLTEALVARLVGRGGELRTGAPVSSISVDRRRVTGVVVAGEPIPADTVVADVPAPALYGGLVGWADLPARTRRGMAQYELDPATIKVDWALSGPVPWTNGPALRPGTVHLGDSVDDLVITQAQITAGRVPSRPFLLTGQMTTADPTRSPAGTEAFWAYTHVPQRVRGDAADDGLTGSWDAAERERMADRVQAEVERRAPGFGSRVLARRVLGPRELEARNRSLVQGALGGGTGGLQQELIFRPVPGLGRAETPIRGLYLGSSSAHPGAGVHGSPGANAARAVIAAGRLGRL